MVRTLSGDPPQELSGALAANDATSCRSIPRPPTCCATGGARLDDLAIAAAASCARDARPPGRAGARVRRGERGVLAVSRGWEPVAGARLQEAAGGAPAGRHGPLLNRDAPGPWPCPPTCAGRGVGRLPRRSPGMRVEPAAAPKRRVAGGAGSRARARGRPPWRSPTPRMPSSTGSSWAASCTRSRGGRALCARAPANFIADEQGLGKTVQRGPRSRPTRRSRRWWSAERA